jgi:hypothetical protein
VVADALDDVTRQHDDRSKGQEEAAVHALTVRLRRPEVSFSSRR